VIDSLTCDGVTFAVRWSRRRRTIGISIDRAGVLAVAAPVGCSARRLEKIVRGKLPWVRRKLEEMGLQSGPRPGRRFADGEVMPYLGRSYRVRLVDDPVAPVRLHRGRFELDRALAGDPSAARERVTAWYADHATVWLCGRVRAWAPLLGAAPTQVSVRDLGQRWGTCTAKGKVSLHWGLVLLPPGIAEYVVVHELAHLCELNHGKRFWALVEGRMPDYRERRTWLSKHAHQYAL
jgi:predicted metal-dependent hydrolase